MTTEGWVQVLWDTVDSNKIDYMPVEGNRPIFGTLYTMAMLFIISLLFLNLFIGVVIETFNRQKSLSSYNQILNPGQRNFLQVLLLSFTKKPVKKLNVEEMHWFRQLCIKVSQHKWFDVLTLVAILINTIALANYYFMIPDDEIRTQELLNYFFVGLFTIEAIIKIIARRRAYFEDPWNRFDFAIVFASYPLLVAS